MNSVGDIVTGSTINQLSVLYIHVTAMANNTTLSKIVRLMERAQQNKAPIQAYADRIACIFVTVRIMHIRHYICFMDCIQSGGNVRTTILLCIHIGY